MKIIDDTEISARAGDICAQFEMGKKYDFGTGVKKSIAQAIYWYRKAAFQGHEVAQYNLNIIFLEGPKRFRNKKAAFYWVQKSAKGYYHDGVLALGWHYLNGIGIRKNIEKAIFWYKKSANYHEPKAYFSLGVIYYKFKKFRSALFWLKKAMQSNHPKAYYYLGRMYFYGCGVKRNLDKAKEYLLRAQELNFKRANRLLNSSGFLNAFMK